MSDRNNGGRDGRDTDLENALTEGTRRFEVLFGEDETVDADLLRQQLAEDDAPLEDSELQRELTRLRAQTYAPLERLILEDDDAREALERRRALFEEVQERPRARVSEEQIERAEDSFSLGSITHVKAPPYPLEIPRELGRSGVGVLFHVDADNGFLSFDMMSGFGDGWVKADAWAGVYFHPPRSGRLSVCVNPQCLTATPLSIPDPGGAGLRLAKATDRALHLVLAARKASSSRSAPRAL